MEAAFSNAGRSDVSQRAASRELVEVRPEHRCYTVTAVVSVAAADGEIREQSKPLWLGRQRAELSSVRPAKAVKPEQAELDHGQPNVPATRSTGNKRPANGKATPFVDVVALETVALTSTARILLMRLQGRVRAQSVGVAIEAALCHRGAFAHAPFSIREV